MTALIVGGLFKRGSKVDFRFTERQERLRSEVRSFCQEEIPNLDIRALDAEGSYPAELDNKMVEKGWFGLPFPKEYGGMGYGIVETAIIAEELFAGGYPGTYLVTVFNALNVLHNGTEEQKREYIPRVIRGEITMSISITEPNAGSDLGGISTKAVEDGDEFVIEGQKVYQSHAAGSDNVMVMVTRTDTSGSRHHGITIFLVPSKTEGIIFRRLDSLGRRIGGLYEVFMEGVRVPRTNMIGELHKGWKVLISGLETERAAVCAGYVGQGKYGLDQIVQFARENIFRLRPIGSYESVAHRLASLAAEFQAAKMLAYRGVWMAKEGLPAMKEVSMAKMFISELLRKIGDFGMEISRGYGYLPDLPMARLWRETRISTVAGGSSQMMRNAIARTMGLKVS